MGDDRGMRDPASLLSARETQVLELGARGMTRGEMAEQLGVTVSTVKFHLASAYRKLGVTNRSQAVARLLRTPPSRHDGR
jgi:LuxR family transcriptional regulator, maltose regulon positive regulatory protein